MYDGVLILRLPRKVKFVGFEDDVYLTVMSETLEEVEVLATEAISMIGWMNGVKLQIAHHKLEVLLVSNCKVIQWMEIVVGDHAIVSKRSLKHLGVMIDDRLNFNSHVDCVCEKSAKAMSMSVIARIMPNVGGPRSSTRRLLASVSSSILRYGVPAWGNALETKRNHRMLQSAFRLMSITDNGRWTHRLIPNLSTWMNRKHGEVNFHLTQFLSGHGCF
ncbi:uncharacterized protein LOC134210074 [Armigeres subalbatus]|uniref:uncharacterized protein LOC134210074 n=1 Tax=Armigeres subalbatus TaxID=124917 RepID=UPI002ED63AEB